MLYKLLGVRKETMSAVPYEIMERQLKIYKWLVIMLLVISFLSAFAFYVYGVVIFHSILIAIVCSLFFGYVVYNLFNLLLLSSLNPMDKSIYRIWIDKIEISNCLIEFCSMILIAISKIASTLSSL